MRDYNEEFKNRVQFIRDLVEKSGVDGIVFGNSGGKDSALVGILCKFACENTVGIMMPCASKRNFEQDMKDAKEVAEHFGIQTRVIDLTDVRQAEIDRLSEITTLSNAAVNNIAPRLRMTTLYTIAASEYRLVAGIPATAASCTWATTPSGAMAHATLTPSPTSPQPRSSSFCAGSPLRHAS